MINEAVNDKKTEIIAPLGTSLDIGLSHILHQVPAAIAILIGPSFIVEMVNSKNLELWGKTYDEVINKPVFQIFPELLPQGFDQILNNVYLKGEHFVANEAPVDLVRYGKKETLYINFTYDPYRNPSGEVIGIICTGTDVTEQVKARQSLVESNERSRIAIELAEMGTWEYNPSLDSLYCSERTIEIFGFNPKESITLDTLLEAIIEKDREKVIQAIEYSMLPESQGNYDVEYTIVNQRDKKQHTVKAKGTAFFENGAISRVIGTVMDITKEITAREMQQKLFALVDNSVELMSILGSDGKNSYINKAGMEMLGFESMQQVLETPITELHTPEDIAFVKTEVLPAIMANGRWSGVMNVRHLKTGEVFPVYNNTIRIDDPITGQPMATGAVMRDLRPEIAAQQMVAESESKFRNVIEQAPTPILILKGEEMILEVANQALFDIWNVGSDAIGKKYLDILPEMKEQGFMELLLKVYHSGQPYYGYEVPAIFHRSNGCKDSVYFNFVYYPYREADGRISGVLVLATDVTGQVQAKNRLLKSEAKLNLAAELSHFGVYDVDLIKQEILHSPRFAEIFGLNPTKQWKFETFTSAVHPDDVPIRTKALEKAMHTGRVFYELRILLPDKSIRWVRLNGRMILENGIAVSSIGTVVDITQEKKTAEMLEDKIRQRTKELQVANENLARSNQQLEQFAHVASHDMKEPIRKISMFTDRIRTELSTTFSPQVAAYFEKVQKAASRLTTMVEGVLTYSTINAAEEKAELVNLNDTINNIESDLELVIQQKTATIKYNQLPVITAAPFLMYQLFYNLVNNSLKFSKVNTPAIIEIVASKVQGGQWYGQELSSDQAYWEIKLSDNGIGFAEENAEVIFKTFARLHSKDQYEGTGLGLALCRNIVEKHNGFIKALGKEGKGATFIILLPANF
ncbi:MAG TPA: PAS domain S-box protein [Flavisolibacter sp.]|nr:PAS domain S-box protein [Flavisolibacter sp.]